MNRDEEPNKELPEQKPSNLNDVPYNDAPELEPSTTGPSDQLAQLVSPQESTQPVVSEAPNSTPPAVSSKKLSGKWLVITIVAAVLVLFGGGVAFAYNFWYQKPEKVISDGLLNAIQAKSVTYKASANVKQSTSTFNVTLSGAAKDSASSADATVDITTSGKTYTLKGNAVISSKGDIYIKVANIDALLKDISAQLPPSAKAVLDTFVKKINDQWIVITNEKIKTFSEEYAKVQKCSQEAYQKLQSDKSYSSEVIDLYKAHPFMKINKQLGSKDGSLGYEVADNATEDKAFSTGLKDTKVFKMMHDCDSNFTIDTEDSTASNSTTTAEIWVSRWTHEITKITAKGTEDGTQTILSFEPIFNKDVKIATPEKAESVDALMQDIQNLESSMLQASLEAQSSQSAAPNDLFSNSI
jgi:hypothetical protein